MREQLARLVAFVRGVFACKVCARHEMIEGLRKRSLKQAREGLASKGLTASGPMHMWFEGPRHTPVIRTGQAPEQRPKHLVGVNLDLNVGRIEGTVKYR